MLPIFCKHAKYPNPLVVSFPLFKKPNIHSSYIHFLFLLIPDSLPVPHPWCTFMNKFQNPCRQWIDIFSQFFNHSQTPNYWQIVNTSPLSYMKYQMFPLLGISIYLLLPTDFYSTGHVVHYSYIYKHISLISNTKIKKIM